MAGVDIAPSFGAELKDAFKPVNAWVASGISWLDDIQQFYRERSAIEKEYGAKLSVLAKKYFDKKAKKSSTLSVGDTPAMTPGSLESASVTTWTTQLTTLESRAAEHERFSSDLITNLVDPLKTLSSRYEEIRKRHAEYAVKLEKEKDASSAELKKVKGSYDGVCQEVETRRKKAESASDYAKQKSQNSYQQQLLDMNNVKVTLDIVEKSGTARANSLQNTYVIAINVANRQKEKYYHEYVPELLDSLQDLSQTRVAKLNAIWSTAAQLEMSTLTRSSDHLRHLEQEVTRNSPTLDSAMFITHNAGNWQEPPDMVFEPSPIWHDDENIVVDDASKIFLKNLLAKSKGQLKELRQEVEKKRREVEGLKRKREAVRAGRDKTDEVELVRTILAMQDELHQIDHKRLTAEVETSTIVSAVGDVSLGSRNHNFKSQTFKIPTNCDLCGDRIWGLSAKGFDCKDCGFTCHNKCELKVPAECPGEQSKEEKKKLKIERQEAAHVSHTPSNGGPPEGVTEMPALSRSNTMNSLSSGYAASAHRSLSAAGGHKPLTEEPAPDETPEPAKPATVSSKPSTLTKRNRIVAPPPAAYITEPPAQSESKTNAPELPVRNGSFAKPKPSEQKGKMLYPYKASGEGEITVGEGRDVFILDPDDGSGWIRIRHGISKGLVPASYVEVHAPTSPQHGSPATDRPSSTYSNSSASLGGSSTMKKKGPAVAPRRGAKKLKYVEALYEYEARTDAEWSMKEGERFVLVNRDAGDGWADVEKGGAVRSVPANYIQDIP